MENGNGKGIFYGVIGVATLVVAIIGATFAYFSATATNGDIIQGTAATAGLSLEVTKVSSKATGGLIPIAETLLDSGLKATDMCVDKNGNTACQVYKIKVTNDGNSVAHFQGALNLTATGYTNLKWANMNSTGGQSSETTPSTVGNDKKESSETVIIADDTYNGGETKYYFVMIYINETDAPQNENDKGSFTGSVTFNSAGGKGTTATFTG